MGYFLSLIPVAYARPSDQEVVWQLEDDYLDYGVLERQQGEEEDTDSEGSNSTWWSERRPCSCANAQCGCCTGRLFPLPVWLRPRMCTNLTYIQDEFALKMAVTFNDVVMYRRKVSGSDTREAAQ
ncbi:uncharacterized protein [Hetaerina americana]|uniref:uncharacterized protein n=1 Tax=Hetaerina americana TaxID=62018 RepID=UPI003A7F4E21